MSRTEKSVAALLLLLLLALYSLISAHAAFDVGDEGYLYYLSWAVSRGQIPFRDFELSTYPPGIFALYALAFDAFGTSIANARGLSIALLLINVALMFAVVRAFGARRFAWLAAMLLALAPGAWHKAYVATLCLSALWLALRIRRGAGVATYALLTMVIALGLQLRLDAAACAIALLLIAAWQAPAARPSPAKLFATCTVVFTLTLLPLLVWLAMQGVLDDYLRQLFAFLGIASERSGAWYRQPPPAFAEIFANGGTALFAALYFASFLLPLGLIGTLIAQWRQRKMLAVRDSDALLVLVFVAMSLPQFLIERPDAVHLCQRGFALIVGGIWLLGPDGLRSALPPAAAKIGRAVIAMFLFCLLLPGFVLDAGGGPGQLRTATHPVALVHGLRFMAADGSGWDSATRAIDHDLTAGDRIAAVPYAPGLNFILQTPTPGRRNYFLPNTIRAAHDDAEAATELASARFITLQPEFRLSPSPRTRIACYAPQLTALINTHFAARKEANDPQLLAATTQTGQASATISPCLSGTTPP